MKLMNWVAIGAVAVACSVGPVQAAGLDGYTAEVTLMQGERTVAHVLVPVPSDGVIRADYDGLVPYPRSVAKAPAEGTIGRVESRETTGLRIEVRCQRSTQGLRIGANADFKEILGVGARGQGGDAADLPNTSHSSLQGDGIAEARGGGWHFDATNPGKDLTLRVDVRPDKV